MDTKSREFVESKLTERKEEGILRSILKKFIQLRKGHIKQQKFNPIALSRLKGK